MTDSAAGWTTERIANQYRLEVHERFLSYNVAYREEQEGDLEQAMGPDASKIHDSMEWQIFCRSEIAIDANRVCVRLPPRERGECGWDLGFLAMFDGTSVAWSDITVDAVASPDGPRILIETILVDYWDDAMAASKAIATAAAETSRTGS